MRIAVDAMGGDHGPSVVVDGAVDAARTFGVEISLVGRRSEIEPALKGKDLAGLTVEIVDAEDVIGMEESPAMAVRRKPKSSIATALREVKEGRAGAMVSTGHSGAIMAGSLAILGRIRGVERPALAGVLPTFRGATIMVDLGAVTDPTAPQLVQFAHMAKVYSEAALGKVNPRVALLSNGEESSKGNQLVQEAFALLKAEPGINFIGNAEGGDILSGEIDVIVTDGFTGNVALKSMEGTFTVFSEIIREEMTRNLPRKLAAFLLKPAFRSIRARLDYAEIGGAPLLGINGVVIIAHGRSNDRAVMNAIGAGKRSADQELPGKIKLDLGLQK